jgi:hypothetical protein
MNAMRRDFRGTICAYCATAEAESDDHVFAGKLFLEADRGDLPKAPSCKVCNGRKSQLELYILAVLPFGGRHEQAMANLTSAVPNRLAKKLKLHRQLYASKRTGLLRTGSIYQPTGAVDFDGEKLAELLKMIVRGLAWHHWKRYLPIDYVWKVLFPTEELSLNLQSGLRSVSENRRVSNNLGRGMAEYEGAQVGEPPDAIMFVVAIYGGIMLSNSSQAIQYKHTSRHWWVIGGPLELKDQIEGLGKRDGWSCSEA